MVALPMKDAADGTSKERNQEDGESWGDPAGCGATAVQRIIRACVLHTWLAANLFTLVTARPSDSLRAVPVVAVVELTHTFTIPL